jgi:hypothetical protein
MAAKKKANVTEVLVEKKQALKKKIRQLKMARTEEKDRKKLALVQRRLRRQRRLLRKAAAQLKTLTPQPAKAA